MSRAHLLRKKIGFSKKNIRFEIIQAGDEWLFVPTEDMWIVHEQSKPASILRRVGLQPKTWDFWKTEHRHIWPLLFDWLYNCRRDKSFGRRTEFFATPDFKPTDAMHSFRQESSIQAIVDSAVRTEKQISEMPHRRFGSHVSPTLTCHWRLKLKKRQWFEGWLLRGEPEPDHVMVATVDQVVRCRQGWDYVHHCATAEILVSTYGEWIERGQIPDFSWLKWLYGASAPQGAFVVNSRPQRLRAEKSIGRILEVAGINTTTLGRWKDDPLTREALEEAEKFVNSPGRKSPTPLSEDKWSPLRTRTKRAILAYAKASTLLSCCERAGLPVANYYAFVKEADSLGVKADLLNYLGMKDPYGMNKANQSGLVNENFFIPSRTMLAFRKVAKEQMTSNRVWQLQHLPGFDDWFIQWATPNRKFNRPKAFSRNGNGRVPVSGPTKGEGVAIPRVVGVESTTGRPNVNADIVAFAKEQKRDEPRVKAKEILSRFKKINPDHSIFQNARPSNALRAALSRKKT